MGKNQIFAGRYEVVRTLGSGGEGTVYLAKDRARGGLVAVKVCPLYTEAAERLMGDAELFRSLRHPGLPRVTQMYREKNAICLITEYVEGESLKSRLAREGRLSEEEAVALAAQLCDILTYLHTRPTPICFLDLKPSNIMLDGAGEPHLIDFGSGGALTRGYAAPEQYLSGGVLDARTDLYALGVTLHFCLTGKNPNQPPFLFESIKKLNPKITNKTAKIIEKLLQPSPPDRFQSAAEVREALLEKRTRRSVSRAKKGLMVAAIFVVAAAVLTQMLPDTGQAEEYREEIQAVEKPVPLIARHEPELIFSLKPGSYASYQLLTVDYDPAVGKLYYTTDGSEPNEKSLLYRDGIVLAAPETTIWLLLLSFDGMEREASAVYEITAPVEKVSVSPDTEIVWDIYYALGKEWTEPLYNYELALIRELPETDLTEENQWLTRQMPFLREE